MVETDYPRGILSQADREYLAGTSNIEPKSQQERNARARIRERVTAALKDFEYLADPSRLQDRDMRQILESKTSEGDVKTTQVVKDDDIVETPKHNEELEWALVDMVAFLFRTHPDQHFFEDAITNGIQRAISNLGLDANILEVEVSIEDTESFANHIERLVDRDVALSDQEIAFAHAQEVLPANVIRDHVQKHGRRTDRVAPETAEKYRDAGQELMDSLDDPDNDVEDTE